MKLPPDLALRADLTETLLVRELLRFDSSASPVDLAAVVRRYVTGSPSYFPGYLYQLPVDPETRGLFLGVALALREGRKAPRCLPEFLRGAAEELAVLRKVPA